VGRAVRVGARRSGGQLIADGRIPLQAIIASIEADDATATNRRLTMPLGQPRAGESASSARQSRRRRRSKGRDTPFLPRTPVGPTTAVVAAGAVNPEWAAGRMLGRWLITMGQPPRHGAAVLIVYYSYTQQTRTVAEEMAGRSEVAACAVQSWRRSSSPTRVREAIQGVPDAAPVLEGRGDDPANCAAARPRSHPRHRDGTEYDLVCIGFSHLVAVDRRPIRSFLESDTAARC